MTQIVGVGTIDVLDRRICRVGLVLSIARALVDAYYLEGKVAHLHVFAHECLVVLGLQFLGLTVVDHQHLAAFLLVDLVDKTTVHQGALHNLRMDGIDTRDAHIHVILAVGHHRTGGIGSTHIIDILLELRFCGSQVFRIEVDPAALAQSGIGFRRHTSIDLHRVGEEVAAHLHRRIDETIAGTQQHDNHEDAPRHSEARERRAEFVSPCRLPYF